MTPLRHWFLLATLGLISILAPGAAFALDVSSSITTNFEYYAVTGNTALELRADMNKHRAPTNTPPAKAFDATTKWTVRWNYRYESKDGMLQLTKFDTTTRILYHLPQWAPPKDANSKLVQRWNEYQTALMRHEGGHAQNGLDAASQISAEVQTLGTFSTKDELQKALDEISKRVIAKQNQADIDYDKTTNHGIKQGARFP